jgi:uncharacterized membrane protein (DUF373 family)
LRRIVSVAFARVQDVVYVVLGLLLALTVAGLLVRGGVDLVRAVAGGVEVRTTVALLDRILLALMVVELLYTLQVSFREHSLVPEPFLLLALIASVRRILVITAEFGAQATDERLFRQGMWELALLTALIVVLVVSVVTLRRRPVEPPPA